MNNYCRVCDGWNEYEITIKECRYKSLIMLCRRCKEKYDNKTLGIKICPKCGLFYLKKEQKYFPHRCPIKTTCLKCGHKSEFLTAGSGNNFIKFNIGEISGYCFKCNSEKSTIIDSEQYDYDKIDKK